MLDKTINLISFVFWGMVSVVILLITLVYVNKFTMQAYQAGVDFFSPNDWQNGKAITVTIPQGAGTDEVAKLLEESGVIKNAYLFILECKLNGTEGIFRGGTFELKQGMDSDVIVSTLRDMDLGIFDYHVVTIREGYTLRDIAVYLEGNEILMAEDFLAACDSRWAEEYWFLRDIPERDNFLEGYLFPDTYYISKDAGADDIIRKMLDRFEDVFGVALSARADRLGLTVDEVMTMASIIEKEIKLPEERGLCSAVIYNRLELGMKLQMCSTVLYVMDKRKDRLLLSDLDIPSPYNTYLNIGLPQGPICNPGAACIEAALYPDEVNYLYFVVKDTEDGEHFFTRSYDEFESAKARYNQQF